MRVLCIDGHDLDRKALGRMLEGAGFTVDETREAKMGQTMIDTRDYDLVLMELRLPDMDGMTALREIRAKGGAKGRIPVLVVTSETGSKIAEQFQAAGGDAVPNKPFKMEALFEAISLTLAEANKERVVLL